jgi:hypothetical protein
MDENDKRHINVPLGTFAENGSEDTPTGFLQTRPGRKRVRTLMGVQAVAPHATAERGEAALSGEAQVSQAIAEALADDAELDSALDAALDAAVERSMDAPLDTSITVEIDESELQDVRDSREFRDSQDALLISDADVIALDSVPPGALGTPGFGARDSGSLPLLIPSQYADAQTRDRSPQRESPQRESPRMSDSLIELSAIVEASQPNARVAAVSGRSDASATAGSVTAIAASKPQSAASTTITAATATTSSARKNTPAVELVSIAPRSAVPVSSLAPREVARPARPAPSAKKTERSGTALWLFAAIVLLAVSGFWLTAGPFKRSFTSQFARPPQLEPASQPTAAAVPDTTPENAVASEPALATDTPEQQAPDQALAMSEPMQPTATPPTAAQPTIPLHHKSASGPVSARAPRVKHAPAAAKLSPQPGGLPDAPSREEVVQRLESVRSSVRSCAAGHSGVADLDITVAHSGVIMHVLVGGDFAGTSQGSCIARAVREARFASFKQERFRLLYPYAI